MTHNELNALLSSYKFPHAEKPLRVLINAGFAHLKPTDFELFILEIFEAFNFFGTLTPSTGDGGIDILLESAEGPIIVQCKRYDDNLTVGTKDLREFLGALVHANAVHGYFVSTSSFTAQAKDFTNAHNNITLIDGECLKKLFYFSIISSIPKYERIDIYNEFYKEQNEEIDFEKKYRIQAEGLYQEYIRELEKIKEKFKSK